MLNSLVYSSLSISKTPSYYQYPPHPCFIALCCYMYVFLRYSIDTIAMLHIIYESPWKLITTVEHPLQNRICIQLYRCRIRSNCTSIAIQPFNSNCTCQWTYKVIVVVVLQIHCNVQWKYNNLETFCNHTVLVLEIEMIPLKYYCNCIANCTGIAMQMQWTYSIFAARCNENAVGALCFVTFFISKCN